MTTNYFLLLKSPSINDTQYEKQKLNLANCPPYDPENIDLLIVQHNKVRTSFDFQKFIKVNNIQIDSIVNRLNDEV